MEPPLSASMLALSLERILPRRQLLLLLSSRAWCRFINSMTRRMLAPRSLPRYHGRHRWRGRRGGIHIAAISLHFGPRSLIFVNSVV